MAMGWLTVLKLVPWGDVIENAPKVAQGAKKLLAAVGKKNVPAATSAPVVAGTGSPASHDAALSALQAQVAALQASTAELHLQMLQSSALIQSLSEQNTQLIARIEVNRRRTLVLFVALLLVAGVSLLHLW
jgi:hypothetical protein